MFPRSYTWYRILSTHHYPFLGRSCVALTGLLDLSEPLDIKLLLLGRDRAGTGLQKVEEGVFLAEETAYAKAGITPGDPWPILED